VQSLHALQSPESTERGLHVVFTCEIQDWPFLPILVCTGFKELMGGKPRKEFTYAQIQVDTQVD
jgi:hypothetical protein